jgi:hypothetical protein
METAMLDNKIVFANLALCAFVFLFLTGGCQQAKYAMWEKFGKEKRHLLRDEVEKAAEEQKEASEQFEDALTRIKALYGFEGGELEKVYSKLNVDYERCEGKAENVRERISSVERIAEDLFEEWEKEAGEITNAGLRARSKQSLFSARNRYKKLHAAMKKAEAGMNPVLTDLRDYVLYLKHNLNAQAIGALKKEADSIDQDISSLIRDMNESIREAESFLKEFE